MTVKAGDDIRCQTLLFGGHDPGEPNNLRSRQLYASIVDAILTLQKTNPIPFYRDEFGELQYVFPATAPCETFTSRKLDDEYRDRLFADGDRDLELPEPAAGSERRVLVGRSRRQDAGARVRARDDAARLGRLVRLRRRG